MHRLNNRTRAEIFKALADARAPMRYGEVTSYDPKTYSAKVKIQPEGIETGWLPILAMGAGKGFGDYWGLEPPAQVAVLHFEGDRDNGLVLGVTPNDTDKPPEVPAGEKWTVHESGSFLKFTKDGDILMSAHRDLTQTVGRNYSLTVTGTKTEAVTGDVTETYSGKQTTNVTGQHVIKGNDINLGDTGGVKVARDQDAVSGGKVQASATKVKAV